MNEKELSDLISLFEASAISGLSSAYLRRMVERNRIWGMKIGRNWVTSKQAIDEYIKKDHPRGRRPKRS